MIMFRQCCKCKKFLGFKTCGMEMALQVTHGYCHSCMTEMKEEYRRSKERGGVKCTQSNSACTAA